jgi:hypothetical protein
MSAEPLPSHGRPDCVEPSACCDFPADDLSVSRDESLLGSCSPCRSSARDLGERLRNKNEHRRKRAQSNSSKTKWQLRIAREERLRAQLSSPCGVATTGSLFIGTDSSADCAVCLDSMTDPVVLLPCAHRFCRQCIRLARQRSSTCPVCRRAIGRVAPAIPGVQGSIVLGVAGPPLTPLT